MSKMQSTVRNDHREESKFKSKMSHMESELNKVKKEERDLQKKEKELEEKEKTLERHDQSHKRHIEDMEHHKNNWGEGHDLHEVHQQPLFHHHPMPHPPIFKSFGDFLNDMMKNRIKTGKLEHHSFAPKSFLKPGAHPAFDKSKKDGKKDEKKDAKKDSKKDEKKEEKHDDKKQEKKPEEKKAPEIKKPIKL